MIGMWFVYDPEDLEFWVYPHESVANEAFLAVIAKYQRNAMIEGVWDEHIGEVCMGRITRKVALKVEDGKEYWDAYIVECD